MADFNPYQAPSAHVEDVNDEMDSDLAARRTRLGAFLIDFFIYFVAFTILLVPIFLLAGPVLGFWVYAGGLLMTVIFIINLVMLYRTGQTIGKRLLNIKIARTDGSRAGLRRIFFLRMLVPNMISSLPFVGYVFLTVDSLFIFQESRRCVHDLIADTIVVLA